ncbi:MAG: hypothetical protein LCH41_10670 [Armatimonadetes bacterium]|nr:hypothetical protein [Armatimonadota bacterium]
MGLFSTLRDSNAIPSARTWADISPDEAQSFVAPLLSLVLGLTEVVKAHCITPNSRDTEKFRSEVHQLELIVKTKPKSARSISELRENFIHSGLGHARWQATSLTQLRDAHVSAAEQFVAAVSPTLTQMTETQSQLRAVADRLANSKDPAVVADLERLQDLISTLERTATQARQEAHDAERYLARRQQEAQNPRTTLPVTKQVSEKGSFTAALKDTLRSGEAAVCVAFQLDSGDEGVRPSSELNSLFGMTLPKLFKVARATGQLGTETWVMLLPGTLESTAPEVQHLVSTGWYSPTESDPLAVSAGLCAVATGSQPEQIINTAELALHRAQLSGGSKLMVAQAA